MQQVNRINKAHLLKMTLKGQQKQPGATYQFTMTTHFVAALCILLLPVFALAQLCSGSLGDPVVNITFGAGQNPGPALRSSTTNLIYANNACPVNGFYSVLNSGIQCNYGWHVLQSDHTGNPNGYFMLIDASFEPNDFYLDTVKGLCANTTYEFAAWMLNMKNISFGIRPNITLNIETTTGQVLQSYNTGDIPVEQAAQWRQYGFFFTTPANNANIVLRMTNKAPGGDGNDLAMDDITFRPCGPLVTTAIAGTNASTAMNLCETNQAVLEFSSGISAGYTLPAYQWQVSTNDGLLWQDIAGANNANYSRQPTLPGNYLYRLSVAEKGNIGSTNCRVASNAITIRVSKNPVVAISNNGPVCTGKFVTLSATGGTNYVWSGPNGLSSTADSIFINGIGIQGRYYVMTTKDGCSTLDSTDVFVNEKPAAQFSINNPLCENSNIIFSNESVISNPETISTWSWNFDDGNISTQKNPSHFFLSPKNYKVVLVAGSSKGCTDTIVKTINVHPVPVVKFGLPEVCLNDAFALFTDSSTITGSSIPGFLYLWNFGDVNATTANPNTSILKNARHSYTSTGNYQVQLTVTSNDGCSNSLVKTFTVNGAVPKANFVIDTAGNFCSHLPVKIINTSAVDFGTITRLEIYWNQNNTALKTIDEQPVPGRQYEFNYGVFGTPATKNIQIKMVAYSGVSCVHETTKMLVLKASPQLRFSSLQPVCANIEPFIITSAGNENALIGTGVYTGTGIAGNGLFSPQFAQTGIHTLTYNYTAMNGCSDIIQQTIQVLSVPVVSAGPDKAILEGGSATLTGSANGNITAIKWLPNIFLDASNTLSTKVFTPADQLYYLTVINSDGCSSADSVKVTVLKTPVVPNAFSPNGDGINDTWAIRYLNSYTDVSVQIFDRYGQMVFQNTGYNQPWNGTKNNKPLPVGVYYYIIDRKIAAPKITGSVTIIR
jgi:gliding motility-associated-like protein